MSYVPEWLRPHLMDISQLCVVLTPIIALLLQVFKLIRPWRKEFLQFLRTCIVACLVAFVASAVTLFVVWRTPPMPPGGGTQGQMRADPASSAAEAGWAGVFRAIDGYLGSAPAGESLWGTRFVVAMPVGDLSAESVLEALREVLDLPDGSGRWRVLEPVGSRWRVAAIAPGGEPAGLDWDEADREDPYAISFTADSGLEPIQERISRKTGGGERTPLRADWLLSRLRSGASAGPLEAVRTAYARDLGLDDAGRQLGVPAEAVGALARGGLDPSIVGIEPLGRGGRVARDAWGDGRLYQRTARRLLEASPSR